MKRIRKTYSKGMTVRQLKEAIKDWPEEDQKGNPTEIFVWKEGCGSGHPIIKIERQDNSWRGPSPMDSPDGYAPEGVMDLTTSR